MKIRYLSLIVLLVMSVFAPIQAQTYDNLWKELEVLERKDLPQSVNFQSNENLTIKQKWNRMYRK